MTPVTEELSLPEQRPASGNAADPAQALVRHEAVSPEQHAALKVRLARLELLVGLGHTDAGSIEHHLPAWLRPTKGEHRLPVTLAVAAAIALQLLIPKDLA